MASADVVYAAFVGMIPTASMLFASFALFNVSVEPIIEACCQNFTAGLIVSAVAAELFPLMTPPAGSTGWVEAEYFGGTTFGFLLGIAMINGVSQLIEIFEGVDEEAAEVDGDAATSGPMKYVTVVVDGLKEKVAVNVAFFRDLYNSLRGYVSVDGEGAEGPAPLLRRSSIFSSPRRSSIFNVEHKMSSADMAAQLRERAAQMALASAKLSSKSEKNVESSQGDVYDVESVRLAAAAVSVPSHRAKIKTIFVEIMNSVSALETNASSLFQDERGDLRREESEAIEERIDQEVHMLQYRLDHARRLLEGSEASMAQSRRGSTTAKKDGSASTSRWVADREKMEQILGGLRVMAFHLLEHVEQTTPIDIAVLLDIHDNVDEMDHGLEELHRTTENASFKWHRLVKTMPVPAVGSVVPPSLIIPVIVDGFFDGFLIGVACSLSRRAAAILACANCLEMSFLGMAVAMRVRKCTGSSEMVRMASLAAPPVMMWVASLVGAAAGSSSKDYPLLFVSFVGFGVVALLYLVMNELLPDAREAMEGEDVWWVNCIPFVGIYIVVFMDRVL